MVSSKDKVGWVEDILGEVRKHVESRSYRITKHAQERQEQHKVTLPNILFILSQGFHEKEKTLYSNEFQTWKYALRGKTIDGLDEFRVIVAFENEMAILTIIRLKRKK